LGGTFTASSVSIAVGTAEIAKDYLLYFILPLWIAAGIVDWFCHRHARIEANAGPKESLIHLLMMGEAGIAILAGLFFTVNSAVILLMLAAWALHEITTMWDLIYANAAREVNAIEQRVHDFLGTLPLLVLSFILIMHWGQFLAIFGLGDAPADWSLTPRSLDISPVYFWGLMAAMALNGLIYLEELLRGLRYRSSRRLYTTAS
jgi:ABC-type amino acid transport system permease subunit